MTRNKAEKRATRARMAKSGERYTTARLYALALHRTQDDVPAATPGEDGDTPATTLVAFPGLQEPEEGDRPLLPPRVADPGMSEAAIRRATGKRWDEWFALLDAWGGTAHNHAEIARHVHEAYGIGGWWAQGVTVGYERARGLRALHERPDGFSMNASKTFFVPVERLFAALVEADERERWLDGVALRLRTSQPNRSARFDVTPGDVRLALTFVARGPEKASVAFQQERLADAGEVARWKALWQAQFAHLAAYLDETASRQDG